MVTASPVGDVIVVRGAAGAFAGAERAEIEGESVAVVQRSPAAAKELRRLVPSLRPRPLGKASSFGFGDRLGCATVGHARALAATGSALLPVLAQQSARELERLGRTFEEVLNAATWGVLDSGWTDGYGADADHLRTVEEVRAAVAAGFTTFTLDPSAHISHGSSVSAAAKYGSALAHVATLVAELPLHVDVEVSIDETSVPTTPGEHRFVAEELRRLGVAVTAIAPRFPGAWSKGTDVTGDVDEIAATIAAHAAVAAEAGHKLSVHSGSDKFAIYAALGATAGTIHVKTSGTSYLEALRVVAAAEPSTFRDVVVVARDAFPEQRASYALAETAAVPDVDQLPDDALPALLDDADARQALHVTFGAVLTDPGVGGAVRACLDRESEAYAAQLERHLGRHLELLGGAA